MNLIDFNSPLWETYKGAYGSVKEDIITLTNEKQLFYIDSDGIIAIL